MANQFLNAQTYANTMLLLLKNQLVFGRLVDGQYKNQVTDQNGLTTSVKRPPRFIDKKDGTANLAKQDIITGSVPVTVDQYSKVHIGVGDIDFISSFNALMQNETMKSAASTLAHSVDSYIAGLTKRFHSWVAGSANGGTNTTDPTKPVKSAVQAMGAHTRLMDQGVPNANLSGVLSFLDAELIRGNQQGSFTPDLNTSLLQRVKIPMISEVDWYASQQLPVVTTGSRSNAKVDGASQNVNYRDVKTVMTQDLDIDNVGNAKTVVAGEVFTIDGVYAWDWRNGVKLDYLQQFTVVTGGTSVADGTGDNQKLTVTISPPIIVKGSNDGTSTDANTAFATVDAAPADNATITWAGAGSTSMRIRPVFHKQAIALVSARLASPYTGVSSFAMDPDTGIAIRYWRGSDISTGEHIHRWDMMYGGVVTDPFLGTRVCGS